MEVKLTRLVEKFEMEIINKSSTYETAVIKNNHISSGAYEMMGKSVEKTFPSLLGFGQKEYDIFRKNMTKAELKEAFSKLSKLGIVGIALSKDFLKPKLILEFVKEYDITLIKKEVKKSELHILLNTYLTKSNTEDITVHASLVNVFGFGVLIQGKSGVGKSEATLDLINRGHFFIGDDAISTIPFSGKLLGKSNTTTRNFLEIRGIGIMNMKQMYGIHKLMKETEINFVVELIEHNPNSVEERLGEKTLNIEINGIHVPYIKLQPRKTTNNFSQLIEAAVIDLKLKQDGYNSSEEFINRINDNLKGN